MAFDPWTRWAVFAIPALIAAWTPVVLTGAETPLQSAHILREAGKADEAIAAYREVAQSDAVSGPDRGGAQLWLAHLLRQKGQRDDAFNAYQKVMVISDVHPHDRGGAQLWIAHLLREAEKKEAAREAYAGTLDLLDAHPHDRGCAGAWLLAIQVEAKEYVMARDLAAGLAHETGFHENDLERAKQLTAQIPAAPTADGDVCKAAMQEGFEKSSADKAAALNAFCRALACADTATQAARARNQIGFILKSQKRAAEARVFLRISLGVTAADAASKADAQFLLAHSWIDQGNFKEAYPAWEKTLSMPELWPAAKSEAMMIVASGYLEKKQYIRARELFQQCIDFKGGENWHKWESQAAIAKSHEAEDDFTAAITALEKLLQMPGLDEGRRSQTEERLKSLRDRLK